MVIQNRLSVNNRYFSTRFIRIGIDRLKKSQHMKSSQHARMCSSAHRGIYATHSVEYCMAPSMLIALCIHTLASGPDSLRTNIASNACETLTQPNRFACVCMRSLRRDVPYIHTYICIMRFPLNALEVSSCIQQQLYMYR